MNRIFVALLLSTVIAFPTLAQQPTSNSSTQTSASTGKAAQGSTGETATGQPPLEDTHTDFWDGEEPGAVALVTHPFANKKYVQRQIEPIRDRLNELEQIAATDGNKTREIDTRTQQGIQLAAKKTDEADQHAVDASQKAQMAQQAASDVNTHLSRVEPVVANVDQYKTGAQTEIRFRAGQDVLSKDAKNALDEMATPLKDQHGYVIEVEGFSSGGGQAAIAASKRMADSVARYLILNHDIPAYRIYAVGMGDAALTGEGETTAKHSSRNRVEINVLRNGLDQTASSPASGASAPPK